jgi:hypothetical protein
VGRREDGSQTDILAMEINRANSADPRERSDVGLSEDWIKF